MEKITRPRGTMDIMAPEIYSWNHIEKKVREIADLYEFSEIKIPTFEDLRLFSRGVGSTTDVVQKEMYTLKDREGHDFALRPEGTASVVRAMIENGKTSDVMPLKLFYLINCFRYEKPQAGRSREFYQFGTEMFGSSDPSADFTVISLADQILSDLGIGDISLHINSIGCNECRPNYRKALIDYFRSHYDELCDDCKERLDSNPLRVLDCKQKGCHDLAVNAPKTVDYLCDDCSEHLNGLKAYLDSSGIDYTIDPMIVRGLDYYTRTVFEFIAGGIGAQSTVCGGGRYDTLFNELGGQDIPACGFAMGISRLILAMKKNQISVEEPAHCRLYIAAMGQEAHNTASQIVTSLRKSGIKSDFDNLNRSLKSQMKYADKIKADYVLFLGDNEVKNGNAGLKDMQTSEQKELAVNDIINFFKESVKR